MAGKATPSPAPMMPLDIRRGMSMKPSSAAVGVKIVNKDQSTTPPPSTILEEYLVAMYPPEDNHGVNFVSEECMKPLYIKRSMSIQHRSAAVGVNIVNKDQSTTPPPSTILEEYLVAMHPPRKKNVQRLSAKNGLIWG